MFYTVIALFFCLACVIQIGFLFLLRFRKQFLRSPGPAAPVSVIICARNEGLNLQQFLPFVLAQDYPQHLFEVIVVNDQSTDNTAPILEGFAQQYAHLKIITVPVTEAKTLPGKKYALSIGIKAAKHQRLLLTDADCKPASDKWLRTMTASGTAHISLGYGAYEAHKGLLNTFIRWETVNTCMQYASYAAAGLPYMGVGRNLCYDRSLLNDLENDEAFQEIYRQTPSGDDDLLISKIAAGENTAVCLNKEAHTISIPQTTWKAWWRQKTRHSSTGKYYPSKTKALLGLYALSHSLYWCLGLFVLLVGYSHPVVKPAAAGPDQTIWNLQFGTYLLEFGICLFLLRLFLYWRNAIRWYTQLGEQKLSLFYPLGDLGWAIYNIFMSPYILWKNKKQWK